MSFRFSLARKMSGAQLFAIFTIKNTKFTIGWAFFESERPKATALMGENIYCGIVSNCMTTWTWNMRLTLASATGGRQTGIIFSNFYCQPNVLNQSLKPLAYLRPYPRSPHIPVLLLIIHHMASSTRCQSYASLYAFNENTVDCDLWIRYTRRCVISSSA